MTQRLLVGLVCICAAAPWACSSDEGGGGSGGSAGTAGSGAMGGTGASANGGSGGSSAGSAGTSSGGTAGSTGGAAGSGDAGMDAEPDAYVYAPCKTGCERAISTCSGTQDDTDACILSCSNDTLGACGDEMKALVECIITSEIQCDNGPKPVDCQTEAQAFETCTG